MKDEQVDKIIAAVDGMTKPLLLRVPADLHAAIKQTAKTEGCSMQNVILQSVAKLYKKIKVAEPTRGRPAKPSE